MDKIFGSNKSVYEKKEKIDEGFQATVYKYLRLQD